MLRVQQVHLMLLQGKKEKTWNFDYACTSTMSVTPHILTEDLQLLWELDVRIHEIDRSCTVCTDLCARDWRSEGIG